MELREVGCAHAPPGNFQHRLELYDGNTEMDLTRVALWATVGEHTVLEAERLTLTELAMENSRGRSGGKISKRYSYGIRTERNSSRTSRMVRRGLVQ